MFAAFLQLSANAAEPYFQANVGATHFSSSGSSGWNASVDEKSKFAWSLGAGLKITEQFAVEAAYSDFGKYSASGTADGIFAPSGALIATRTAQGTAHIQGPSVSAVVSRGSDSFDPHFKIGAFYDIDSHDVTFTQSNGVTTTSEGSNKVGLIAGIGATFNKHFTVDYTFLQETNAWAGRDIVVQALTVGYKF